MKIKLKLFLKLFMATAILFPAAAILLTGLFSMLTYSYNMLSEEAATLSYSQTSGLDLVFDEYLFGVNFVANHSAAKETAQWRYGEIKDSMDAVIKNLTDNNPYILDIVITDIDGVVCADFKGRDAGSLYAGYNEDVESVTKNEIYFSAINMKNSEYSDKSTFYLMQRIKADDADTGYVSIVISTDCFSEFFKTTRFLESGDIFIVDGKGTAVNLDNALNANKEEAVSLTRFDEIKEGAMKSLIGYIRGSRKNSPLSYTPFDEGGFTGYYGNIATTNWTWAGVYPKSASNAMVISDYLTGLLIVGLFSACFMALTFLISRKVISPMDSMIKKMNIIVGEGNRTERFVVKGNNEYAHMSAAFNELIGEVALSEELHRTVSDLSDNMLFEWDFKKERMYLSDNLCALFNINTKVSTLENGKFIDALMEQEYADKFKQDMAKLLKTRTLLTAEYRVLTKTGTVIWVSMRAQCVADRFEQLIRVVGVITNIDNEKKLTLRLSERASYDFLSQLYNRSTFERELQSNLQRSVNSRVGVIFIDVDDFKFINDRYGHSTGDEIIKHVSKIIKNLLKDGGFAGRFGGDEFVMCVTDENLLDNIDKLATRLIEALNLGYRSDSAEVFLNIKASIGIAIAPQHGKDGIILIAAADEAMYYVKKNGKCNYHIYDPDDSNLIDMMHTI